MPIADVPETERLRILQESLEFVNNHRFDHISLSYDTDHSHKVYQYLPDQYDGWATIEVYVYKNTKMVMAIDIDHTNVEVVDMVDRSRTREVYCLESLLKSSTEEEWFQESLVNDIFGIFSTEEIELILEIARINKERMDEYDDNNE